MFIIDSRKLAKEKVARLQNGYSAYAESEELANLIRKELSSLKIGVHEDVTEKGYWFIPIKTTL